MSDGYNKFGAIINPNGYNRVSLYCDLCKTPIWVNRAKDAPKFCQVCHTLADWRYVDKKWKKEWASFFSGIEK